MTQRCCHCKATRKPGYSCHLPYPREIGLLKNGFQLRGPLPSHRVCILMEVKGVVEVARNLLGFPGATGGISSSCVLVSQVLPWSTSGLDN